MFKGLDLLALFQLVRPFMGKAHIRTVNKRLISPQYYS